MDGYTYPVPPVYPAGQLAVHQPILQQPYVEPFQVKEPEPLELSSPVDEDSWRYSRFALPWLLTVLAWLIAIFCLTFWQQAGDIKRLYDGVPRILELAGADSKEGGLPVSIRNLRIASGWFGFFGIIPAFAVFFARPKRGVRVGLNMLYTVLLLVSAVLAWIAFAIALGKYPSLVNCPEQNRWTLSKCANHTAYETAAIALDAAVGFTTIVAALLLAYNSSKGHWKLAPRDWDEAVDDTQERPKERAPGEKPLRNVTYVRNWITGLALLAALASIAALQVFVVIVHEDRTYELLYGPRGRTDPSFLYDSRLSFEHSGWPTVNTRIRYSAVGVGIVTALLNFLPFRAKIIAFIFAFLYISTAVILMVAFGFDVHQLRRSVPCGTTYDGLELKCTRGSFIATVILDFIASMWLVVFVIIEYVVANKRQCQHCERAYQLDELSKHEANECAARPVRCEVCAKSMMYKEFCKHKQSCSVDHSRCKNCGTVVPKWGVKGHQEECPRFPVKCTMCDDTYQRSDLPHHVMVCPHRPASCDACGETFRSRDMEAHKEVCGEVLVQCNLCHDHLQRFRLQQHEQYHCPKTLLHCNRCEQRVPRFRWERHVSRECLL